MTWYLGIDVSAARGLDLALLDADRCLRDLRRCPDVAAVLAGVEALHAAPRDIVVAIDAPQRYVWPAPDGWRACDRALQRRGLPLYKLSAPDAPLPGWIAVGFALFEAFAARGLRPPVAPDDTAATLLEVYPHASFVSLIGCVPARKSTAAGLARRRAALAAAGIQGLPPVASHDALDAIVAAFTGQRFHSGQGSALGEPADGLMILPVPAIELASRYRRCGLEATGQ